MKTDKSQSVSNHSLGLSKIVCRLNDPMTTMTPMTLGSLSIQPPWARYNPHQKPTPSQIIHPKTDTKKEFLSESLDSLIGDVSQIFMSRCGGGAIHINN